MLTQDEKRRIVNYITGWSVKPIFEDGVIEGIDSEEREMDVQDFLDQCGEQLSRWVESQNDWRE